MMSTEDAHATAGLLMKHNSKLNDFAGKCFKFGQTTLEGHALAGEESFAVNWRPDNSVWYSPDLNTNCPGSPNKHANSLLGTNTCLGACIDPFYFPLVNPL